MATQEIIEKYELVDEIGDIGPCVIHNGAKEPPSHHDNLFRSFAKFNMTVAKERGVYDVLAPRMKKLVKPMSEKIKLLKREDVLLTKHINELRHGVNGVFGGQLLLTRNLLSEIQKEVDEETASVQEITASFASDGNYFERPFGATSDVIRNTILLKDWKDATNVMRELKNINKDVGFYIVYNKETDYFGIHCRTFKQNVPGEIMISQVDYYRAKSNYCDKLSAKTRMDQSSEANTAFIKELVSDQRAIFLEIREKTNLNDSEVGIRQLAKGLSADRTYNKRRTIFAPLFEIDLNNGFNQPDYGKLDLILQNGDFRDHVLNAQGILNRDAQTASGGLDIYGKRFLGKKCLELGV